MQTCARRIPRAVELSVSRGVPEDGCGWPILVRAVIMGTAAWALRKRAPVSASAAEAATERMVLQRTWTAAFGVGLGG